MPHAHPPSGWLLMEVIVCPRARKLIELSMKADALVRDGRLPRLPLVFSAVPCRQHRRFPNPFRLVLPLLILAIALVSPAMAAAPSLPNAATAATSCDRGRSIYDRLGAADVTYASDLLPCILRTERAQLRLGFHESRVLSQSVAGALKLFIAGTRLGRGPGNVTASVNATMNLIGAVSCPSTTRYRFAFNAIDSDPPPVLTPLSLARSTAQLFSHRVMHRANLTFGVAIRRGVMFRGNDRDGVATGWIAVWCS